MYRCRGRAAAPWSRETLAAMLDEKLTRREVKDIQSGYKDPDRFEKWLAVLQERGLRTTIRSCCRWGRG